MSVLQPRLMSVLQPRECCSEHCVLEKLVKASQVLSDLQLKNKI